MKEQLVSTITGAFLFSLLIFNGCSQNQAVYRSTEQQYKNRLIIRYPRPIRLEEVIKKHPYNRFYNPTCQHQNFLLYQIDQECIFSHFETKNISNCLIKKDLQTPPLTREKNILKKQTPPYKQIQKNPACEPTGKTLICPIPKDKK